MKKHLYVVDNILLFHPDLEDREVIDYVDLEEAETDRYLMVTFFTYDIYNCRGIFHKLSRIFMKFFPKPIFEEDVMGNRRPATLLELFRVGYNFFRDGRHEKDLTEKIGDDVEKQFRLQVNKTYRSERTPVYIKTTLCIGVQSGGALAHSAGVIKGLIHWRRAPVIFTSDCMAKDLTIPSHYLRMKRYQDFSDSAELYFNISAYQEITRELKNRKLSFIYQRNSLNCYLGVRLSNQYRVPYVLEYNGSDVWVRKNWNGNKPYKFLDCRLSEKIEDLNIQKADLVVCVSEPLKQELLARGVPERRILVNYNGVDVNTFRPEIGAEKIRSKLGIAEDCIVIGFIGSFDLFHGAENLARAYGKLMEQEDSDFKNLRILLIGDGSTLKSVKRILRQYRQMDTAYLTGSVPFEEAPDYLAACDILVAPHVPNKDGSSFFGSPTKLFEYMAMGKAIVASNLGQIGEILEGERTALLVEPGNVQALSEALSKLVKSRELRRELGKNARECVTEHYSWDRHVQKILEALERLYRKGED